MKSDKIISNEQKADLLKNVEILIALHKNGELGGEVMPEDANPGFHKGSKENYIYFTLPMALNYQRNSYKLWSSAKAAYEDPETTDIYNLEKVIMMPLDELRQKLMKHKVALQPSKQTDIWLKLSDTFISDFNGDVRVLFSRCNNNIKEIKEYILEHKKQFPYLSGTKILNYWLYVMMQYTDVPFKDIEHITVAPDTHVIQASAKLGLIDQDEIDSPGIREAVSELWNKVFEDTARCPIEIHTPLWLWSRGGFSVRIDELN